MKCTIKELELGHEYVLISADVNQTEVEVYHATLVKLNLDDQNIASAIFKVKEFEGERDMVWMYRIVHNSYCKSNVEKPLNEIITIDAYFHDATDPEVKNSRIFKIFHPFKSSTDKNGSPTGGKFYVPKGMFIGYDWDDVVKTYDEFLQYSLSEHQKKIDKEQEILNSHKESFKKQIDYLKGYGRENYCLDSKR